MSPTVRAVTVTMAWANCSGVSPMRVSDETHIVGRDHSLGLRPMDRGQRISEVNHFLASTSARRSNSAAAQSRARITSSRTLREAQSFASTITIAPRSLRATSVSKAAKAGASAIAVADIGRSPEAFLFGDFHVATFAPVHLVIQRVIQCFVPIEAPMDQLHLPLLCRLDAPSVVPPQLIADCKSYREAVQLCWLLRRVRNMTRKRLAEDAGLYAPHVTCYLNDNPRARDLPGSAVRGFEWACGNTAISQWHNANAKLTCLEELQALRAAS